MSGRHGLWNSAFHFEWWTLFAGLSSSVLSICRSIWVSVPDGGEEGGKERVRNRKKVGGIKDRRTLGEYAKLHLSAFSLKSEFSSRSLLMISLL